ncbi:MAG: Ig-like domain-containing protein, partial [Thermoplasmatales archaeon]|nr:Ig-like domain-containing protein [Thermoplasmatales archaeon]
YHYGVNLGPVSVGSMYDIRDFAYKIKNVPLIEPLIKDRAEALINAIDAACIHFAITTGISNMYPQVRGLSIYIPADINQEYNEVYDELDFAKHKYWDEFIHCFKERKNAENTPPAICITTPVEDLKIIVSTDNRTIIIRGTAFDVVSVEKVEVKINDGEWVTVNGVETWNYEWKTTPGKHTIYARSFDGTGYSTVSSVNVDVVSKENEAGGYLLVILLLIATMAVLVIIAVIKQKRNLHSSK